MNKKQLAINLLSNAIAFTVQFGINFFFTPYLIRTVGKEAYSFFPLANSFISYTSIITIALNSMASRFITIKIQQNNIPEANIYFNSVLRGNTYIALFLTIPSILMVCFASKILNIPPQILPDIRWLFGLVFLSSIISIATDVYGVATFAKNQLHRSSIRNTQVNIGRILVLLLLFYFMKPSILFFGIVNLLVAIYIYITDKRFTRLLLPEITVNRTLFKKDAIIELLKSGVWNSINQLSLIILTNLDLLICNLLLGASETGDFALVKTIPIFIQSVVGVLVSVFVPEFIILYAQNKKAELLISINRSIKFMSLIMTIPLGFLLIYGNDFFTVWVAGQNSHKLYMLSTLTIIPLIITTSINTIFNVYTVTNKLKMPALVLLATGILNTILIITLIKTTSLGIFAIPLVSMTVGVLRNLLFTPIYASRCLNVKWNTFYKAIIRGLTCCFTVICLSILTKSIITISIGWAQLLISGITVGLGALFLNSFIIFDQRERSIIYTLARTKINQFKNNKS